MKGKKLLIITLLIASVVVGSLVLGEINSDEQMIDVGAASLEDGDPVISNEHLSINVYADGGFTGETASGECIFYPGDTSMLTVKVDGNVYDNENNDNLDYYRSRDSYINPSNDDEIITEWDLPEDIHIEQHIELVGEQAKFNVILENEDSVGRDVSVRFLWDTQIADNDGSPLKEEGGTLRYFEAAFSPVTFNYWSAYARPDPGSLVEYASWDDTPDRIVFAHWPEAVDTSYDYSWSSSRRFYTPGYTSTPESDSCVLMYWEDMSLHPGETETVTSYYGTTTGGGVNVDISTDKQVYSPGERVTISADVTDASGDCLYPLQDEDFIVTFDGSEADIVGFNRISCTDYRLEITAPDTGGDYNIMVRTDTSVGWGSDSSTIEVLDFTIDGVTLSIEGNRLTQYENSADTPIYHRNSDSNKPVFNAEVLFSDGTATYSYVEDNIEVYLNITDHNQMERKDIEATPIARGSGNSILYSCSWKPTDQYPVGKYNATVEVKNQQGELLASSEQKQFYLIFNPPIFKLPFVAHQISAEIHHAAPAPAIIPGANFFGVKFNNLHQWEYRNWKNTLETLTGNSRWDLYPAIYSPSQAIERLTTFSHGIDIGGSVDDSHYGYWHMDDNETKEVSDNTHLLGDYIYGSFWCNRDYESNDGGPEQNAWWYDVNKFKDSNFNPDRKNLPYPRPTGVCADYAPLLISHARSAGIPAREIGGFFAGDSGHAVTEVYYDGDWHHCDPTWDETNTPWTYSDQGYFWASYKTSSISPWGVVSPGIKIDVIDRKNQYNYRAKAISFTFDKSDYDYSDTVNVDITIKNIGDIKINEDYLHLNVYDKPTLSRFRTRHIKDIKIRQTLQPGDTKTYSCTYQLPDYGSQNERYERMGDRYVVAEIDYYDSLYSPYHSIATVTKVGKRVPGLCDEYNSQISVINTTIRLDTANLTSLHYNNDTNISTESYVEPHNTSVSLEHEIKYYTNYTRENWVITNPDNETHHYNLTIPLLGIGDAVYVPGYGTITENQSLDTTAEYLVFYNITNGTASPVDIYTFTRNISLENICFLDGVAKIQAVQNCTLAPSHTMSYLSYLSTRNGTGVSFPEIYSNFSQDILSHGDTLTHLSSPDMDEIFHYRAGQTANINLTLSNAGEERETKSLHMTIAEPGVWNSNHIIYNYTESVDVPADGETTATFQYTIPNKAQLGTYLVTISDGTHKIHSTFIVESAFNVTFDVPNTVTQGEGLYITVNLTNELQESLSDVTATLDLPNDFETSDNLTVQVGELTSGEQVSLGWQATATDFEYGYAPISIALTSAENISTICSTFTQVLRTPQLSLAPSAPSWVYPSQPFEFKINVSNTGDMWLHDVIINLSLPNNVSASEDATRVIGNLSGGETKTMTWTVTASTSEDFGIIINASDATVSHTIETVEIINVTVPQLDVDLTVPDEVKLGSNFSAVLQITNIGEGNASSITATLNSSAHFASSETEKTIDTLAVGETVAMPWNITALSPGSGTLDFTASCQETGPTTLTKGIIITHFPLAIETHNESYLPGNQATFTVSTQNSNPDVSFVDLTVQVTIQGPSTNTTFSKPILYIDSLASRDFVFTWDTIGKDAGLYTVTAAIKENDTLLNQTETSFEIEDINPPTISNISTSPEQQETGGHVNISCDITDNIAVNNVWVNITYPDGSSDNESMVNIRGTDRYYHNTSYQNSGSYHYKVGVSDTSGNTNISSSKTYSILLANYTLDASVDPAEGGTISLVPSGGTYDEGTVVTVTANANSGYEFDHWSGDISGTSTSVDVTMNSDKSVTAHFNVTADNISFEEKFDDGHIDTSTWKKYGSPQPVIVSSIDGRSGIFDNNGDSWCGSGVISQQSYSLVPPITIEADMYLDLQDESGCWAGASIYLASDNNPLGESSNCPDTDFPWFLSMGIGYCGGGCLQTPEQYRGHAYLNFAYETEQNILDEGPSEGDGNIQRDDLIDGWHNYKIKIDQDYKVSYYVDNELIYKSDDAIDSELLTECYIMLGSRSSGSAGKAYHDYIKLYSSSDIVEQYAMTTSVIPSGTGTVTLSPPGGTYDEGTVVTVTANANSGYEFDHWSGDASGTNSNIQITISSNTNVTAYFSKKDSSVPSFEFTLLLAAASVAFMLLRKRKSPI